jgi:membrane-associated phospholipid phosphatase
MESAGRSAVHASRSKSIFHDICSPRLFAKHPWVGVAMFFFGSVVFGVLAYNLVNNGPLLRWDLPLARSLHTASLHSPEWVKALMIAGYYVGDQAIIVIGVVLAIYFVLKRSWCELTMLTCGFGISALLFLALSHSFDRPRPHLQPEIWPGPSTHMPGFPSGHAIAVVSSYGLLTYFLLPKIRSRSRKALVIAAVALLGLYVNFSRLFVCDHFLTDIIAGTAVGIAWLGFAQTAVELLFRKKPAH